MKKVFLAVVSAVAYIIHALSLGTVLLVLLNIVLHSGQLGEFEPDIHRIFVLYACFLLFITSVMLYSIHKNIKGVYLMSYLRIVGASSAGYLLLNLIIARI